MAVLQLVYMIVLVNVIQVIQVYASLMISSVAAANISRSYHVQQSVMRSVLLLSVL